MSETKPRVSDCDDATDEPVVKHLHLATIRGHDAVTHPPHYVRLSPEPLSVIESWGLDYHRGNALKYLARAGFKVADGQTKAQAEAQDLRKAAAYLLRLADTLDEDGT